MTENTGAAIGAHREAVRGQARPQRLQTDVDIKAAVEDTRDNADMFKVYLPEWLTVYTSEEVGDKGRQECEVYFSSKYEGRVRQEDIGYEATSAYSPDQWPWRLKLQLPNIKGEFKTRVLAEEYVRRQGWQDRARVVARNSRDEYALKDYGVKKLPKGA